MLEFIPTKQVLQRLSEGWEMVDHKPGCYTALMRAPEGWEPQLLDNKKPFRTCSVKGCAGKHRARGFCTLHYDRFKRYGDPHTLLPKGRKLHVGCTEPGCQNVHRGHGLCHKHLQRAQKAAKCAFECAEAA